MIIGLATVPLIVDEYERAIEFYCGKLGFIVLEDTQLKNKRWVRIRTPGGQGSDILLSRAENEKQFSAIGNQTGGRVLFFFHTDNFEEDYSQLVNQGIELLEGPLDQTYGKVAVFKDLYGNRFDLIEPYFPH